MTSKSKTRHYLRTILPWVIAAGLVGFMFYRIDPAEVAAALRRAHLVQLVLTVLFLNVGALMTDSFATARVFSWFLAPVRFVELVPVRAATYLMAILNYHLGQAGLVYYMYRAKGVKVSAVTGVTLMMMGTMLLLVGAFATVGVFVAADERTSPVKYVILGLAAGTALYFLLIRLRPRWLMRRTTLRPLFDAGIGGHLRALVVRIPHLVVIVLAHYLAMRSFDIRVPVGTAITLIPVVLLVASLPITPYGLGTVQVLAVSFFAPFASGTAVEQEAAVLAYSLAVVALALVIQASMGLLCLRRVMAMIQPPPPAQHPGDEGGRGATRA